MKALRGLHLFVVLTVLLVSAVVFTPAAEAMRIHALLIILDGDAVNFIHYQKSQEQVERFLNTVNRELNIPVDTVHLLSSAISTDPKYTSSANILEWLDSVSPRRNDVVFVYYAGHGGADKSWPNKLFLSLPSERKFYREHIVKAIEGLDCRLKLLITDTCSFGPPITEHLGAAPSLRSALANLFFEHKGFLNLTAATEGELAASDSVVGGWFTRSLVISILQRYSDLDTNGDNFVSWAEVFKATRTKTMRYFEMNADKFEEHWKKLLEEIGQTTQRPKYYGELPKRIMR